MDVVGALVESPRVRTAAPHPRTMAARRAFAAVQRAQVPWLLTLLPVGSLLAAGLLVLLLSRLVPMPPAPPAVDMPSLDAGGDEWIVPRQAAYTR